MRHAILVLQNERRHLQHQIRQAYLAMADAAGAADRAWAEAEMRQLSREAADVGLAISQLEGRVVLRIGRGRSAVLLPMSADDTEPTDGVHQGL